MATSSLQGKSVIVTGASKGIGKGIARVFARDGGAKVLVVSRHLKEAEAAAKEFGNGATGFAADVTKPEDMAAMAKAATEGGALDVKTKELMALAIAVAIRCDGCVAFHAQAAVKHGATRDEIMETMGMALYMGAGPSLMYAAQAVEAFDQFAKDGVAA